MKRWHVITLCIVVLVGMTAAAWLYEQHAYTIDLGIDFKLVALTISAAAITVAAGMFIWRLFSRVK